MVWLVLLSLLMTGIQVSFGHNRFTIIRTYQIINADYNFELLSSPYSNTVSNETKITILFKDDARRGPLFRK